MHIWGALYTPDRVSHGKKATLYTQLRSTGKSQFKVWSAMPIKSIKGKCCKGFPWRTSLYHMPYTCTGRLSGVDLFALSPPPPKFSGLIMIKKKGGVEFCLEVSIQPKQLHFEDCSQPKGRGCWSHHLWMWLCKGQLTTHRSYGCGTANLQQDRWRKLKKRSVGEIR